MPIQSGGLSLSGFLSRLHYHFCLLFYLLPDKHISQPKKILYKAENKLKSILLSFTNNPSCHEKLSHSSREVTPPAGKDIEQPCCNSCFGFH